MRHNQMLTRLVSGVEYRYRGKYRLQFRWTSNWPQAVKLAKQMEQIWNYSEIKAVQWRTQARRRGT